jgi:undecaprenyl-phosphate 4-deoxy-4-formamido-L-arabinose transferase
MLKNPRISIVIPVYNAEQNIKILCSELVFQLKPKYDLELVLVNDGSQDASHQHCLCLQGLYPNTIRYFDLAKNVGEHNAVMAGLNQTTGDFVIIMDDDFQNPISELGKMVDRAQETHADVVYSYYSKKQHSWFRNLGSGFNDYMATLLLRKPKNLYLSSFKLINRFLVNEIIKYDLPFPYIDGLILRTTDRIATVQVKHEKRVAGSSNYTPRKLFSLWMNMFTNFSIIPLRLSVLLGAVFSVFGFGYGVFAGIEKWLHPDLPMGYTTIIVLISLFAGIQLMALGMLGEYLGRIFLSQNKTPQYAIRKAYTNSGSDGSTGI